ncbi:MAG: ABC transporter ATP-binding protein [Trueperaceae bacterium]
MTSLTLQNLSKSFGSTPAVKDLNLQVTGGSLVALLGPSGCGKTTTLRMIAGLETPSAGDILFNDTSVLSLATHKRNIGMVFQRYVLFAHMNVEKNISFGLRMRGLETSHINQRVADVLEIVQLQGLEKRFPSQLSGGQQQRVAIARTIITQPSILLMDEPLSNLDAQLRDDMRTFIRELQKRLSITTLFVTHDQSEALELADKVGLMMDGELVQCNSPQTLFKQPRTKRIAEFLGSSNFLEGVIKAKSETSCVIEALGTNLQIAQTPRQTSGESVTATIRPEHIEITKDKKIIKGEVPNSIRATVVEAIYSGGMIQYKVRVGNTELEIKERSLETYHVGDDLQLRLAPEHLWIFE